MIGLPIIWRGYEFRDLRRWRLRFLALSNAPRKRRYPSGATAKRGKGHATQPTRLYVVDPLNEIGVWSKVDHKMYITHPQKLREGWDKEIVESRGPNLRMMWFIDAPFTFDVRRRRSFRSSRPSSWLSLANNLKKRQLFQTIFNLKSLCKQF